MAAPKLIKGIDYYLNAQGLMVLTAHYLRKRGYCCGNGCTHCPYPVDGIAKAGTSSPTTRRS